MFSVQMSSITNFLALIFCFLNIQSEATNLLPSLGGKEKEPVEANNKDWLPAKNEGGTFTLRVGAREEFCFIEYFDLSVLRLLTYKVAFRVIKGGKSKDIDFYIKRPTGTNR